jgi:hypothetical protein
MLFSLRFDDSSSDGSEGGNQNSVILLNLMYIVNPNLSIKKGKTPAL